MLVSQLARDRENGPKKMVGALHQASMPSLAALYRYFVKSVGALDEAKKDDSI